MMIKKIDVHVLLYPNSPKDWFEECLNSLHGESINLTVIESPNVYEEIGKYRVKGYSTGTEEYVSFVDADDYIIKGAYNRAIHFLNNNDNHDHVCTQERVYYESTKSFLRVPLQNHHIKIFRREFLESYYSLIEKQGVFVDKALSRIVGPSYDLGYIGYVWRFHDGGWHKVINKREYGE